MPYLCVKQIELKRIGFYLFKSFLSIITRFIIILFAAFVYILPAWGCEELQMGYFSKVSQITDGDSVVLSDGTRVRLLAIQAPKLALGRKNFLDWPLAEDAKQALASVALGAKVRLDFASNNSDRHGRTLAHLYIINEDNSEEWVQKYMIEHGMARVYSFADNRLCVKELLKIEAEARANRKGIWANDYYQIRFGDKPNKLLKLDNRYELVEGRVLSAKKVGSRIYLNFGKNWRDDFTIVIEKYGQKIFSKAGVNALDYQDALIRVRGWIEIRDGPRIEVTHPEQIEVLAIR